MRFRRSPIGAVLGDKFAVEARPCLSLRNAVNRFGDCASCLTREKTAVYPLIRFATGDLPAVLAGASLCGRTNIRIKGWMGRADQTTKVRGMFVHPHQIAEIVKRHPAIHKARLTVSHVDSADAMVLSCETSAALDMEAVKNSIREVTKLRGEVALVANGALANDGKVIDDCRSYA